MKCPRFRSFQKSSVYIGMVGVVGMVGVLDLVPHDARVAPLEGVHLLLGSDVGGVAQLVALHSVPREA
eukprot:scaffold15590_cov61-Phaeocystis_antarctica.AAC.1